MKEVNVAENIYETILKVVRCNIPTGLNRFVTPALSVETSTGVRENESREPLKPNFKKLHDKKKKRNDKVNHHKPYKSSVKWLVT